MNDREKLKKMLETGLIPQLETFLKQLETVKAMHSETQEDEAVYDDTLELKRTFVTLLADIDHGKMDDAEAHEIIKELKKYHTAK